MERRGRRCGAAFVIVLATLSCFRANLQAGDTIDPKAARQLSDAVVDDVVEQRHARLRSRMEKAFRDATSDADVPGALDQLYSYGGRPLEAEFKLDEVGEKLYLGGGRKPVRKFWYAVRTTKAEKGTYFMFVEVVPDGDHLACAQFSIVAFQNGPPAALK